MYYNKLAILYPTEITTFTKEQCDEIQRHFRFKLLPKLGLNRHTPLAVVHGPINRGGCGIADLYCEQTINHLNTTTAHLRREDQAGQGIISNMNAMQLISGSEKCFLTLDPSIYSYMEDNTRITYLWKAARELGITPHIGDKWVPFKRYPNDVSIMDAAVQDSTNIKYKKNLQDINACRIYLKVIFLSDMVHYTGNRMKLYFINGQGQRLTTPNINIVFPTQPMPTKSQWERWKSFIHRTFLERGLYLINPIQIQLKRTNKKPIDEMDELIQWTLRHNETSLSLTQHMPSRWKKILGHHNITDQHVHHITRRIAEGTAVGATDGSLIPNTLDGTYAYTLTDEDTYPLSEMENQESRNENQQIIIGSSTCPEFYKQKKVKHVESLCTKKINKKQKSQYNLYTSYGELIS